MHQKTKNYIKGLLIAIGLGITRTIYALGEGDTVTLDNPIKSPNLQCFIADVLQIVVNLGSIVCVFFIIYSGFLFVTARGDESQVTKARNTFFWTVVGTAVLLGAWVLAQVVSGTIGSILQQNIDFSCSSNG